MTKITFKNEKGETGLVTHLFKIILSDPTKESDRLKIKLMSRILDKMEEYVKYETVTEGTAFMLKNPSQDQVIVFEQAEFDKVYACLKAYQPTVIETRAVDKLYNIFEAAEKVE